MPLHETTFGYIRPSTTLSSKMEFCRVAAATYAKVLEQHVPEGPDKTYLLRKLREVSMWANVAISRQPDGTPRE